MEISFNLHPFVHTLESPLKKVCLHRKAGSCSRRHVGQSLLAEMIFKISAEHSLCHPTFVGESKMVVFKSGWAGVFRWLTATVG